MSAMGEINRGILRASFGAALVGSVACSASNSGGSTGGTSGAPALSNGPGAGGGAVSAPPVGTGSGSVPGSVIGAGGAGSAGSSATGGTHGVIIPPIGAGGIGAAGTPPIGLGAGGAIPPLGGAGGAPVAVGGGAGGSPEVVVPVAPPGKNCLKPGNGTYMSPGPYTVATEDVDLGMISSTQHTGKFTIYYPSPFEASCPHPIVAWGNGTGVTDSNFTYDFLNRAVATWGMVVAASSEDNTGSGLFHKAGIDYLLKQNMDMTSKYFGKLSTRAGVSGHSQGGLGAGLGAAHPNVVALVVEGMTFTWTMKVPGLTLTGTNDIVQGAAAGVTAATGPDFVAVWDGGNHVGTETVLGYLGLDTTSMDATGSQKGSIQFQRLMSAWFRCFLASDEVACKLFQGGTPTGCGICKDPGWSQLASKNL